MNTVHTELPTKLGLAQAAKQAQRRAFGLVVLCLLVLIGLFASTFRVRTERFRCPDGTSVAWRWYRLGTIVTASDVRAKLQSALDRLLRRDDTYVWVAVYVMETESPSEADRTLARFAVRMGGALEQAAQGVVVR